jgi:putrescine transport system substrate-binding protein
MKLPLFALAALSVLGFSLGSCSKPPDNADEKQVSIYNWADYIGKHTIADFEAATGIKVDYDTFDADATLEAKMLAGGSGYDVIETSTNYFSRQIKAGAYHKLDKSLLRNWGNIDPKVLELFSKSDPGNQYAVPYTHAINGFAYNVDMIRARMPNAPVDSLDLIFKPEIIAKFQDCGVTFLDSAEDVLQFALLYLHRNPNTTNPADYKAAEELVLTVRPYIKNFDSVEYLNALANRESCIAMGWASDYSVALARAKAAGISVNLAFTIPKEGANATYSAWLIPVDSPHVKAAHAFLDFMLRPRVIADVTNDIHYGNENLAAIEFVDQAIKGNPALYPPPETQQRLYLTDEVSAATERVRTRSWTRIKTAH